MDYTRTVTGAIQSNITLTGITIIYQASNIRRERTGIHATISIGLRQDGHQAMPLDGDTYNVDRREERERLVNSIYKKAAFKTLLDAGEYDPTRMGLDLMLFQRGLWAYEVGTQEGESRSGSLQRIQKPFIIKPYVAEGSGTILFAPPGRGKSWAGMIWAVCVDAGIDTLWPVEQGPAFLVNLERSAESVDVRLGDVNEALGLQRERPILRLDRRGRTLPDIIDGIQRTIKKEGVSMVIVDSLSRAGFGNMNDNDPANKAMDALNSLSPAAWVVLAHTPRGDESHTFGSQMFDAAADVTVQLITDDKSKQDTMGLGFRVEKANDIPKNGVIQQIALDFDWMGLKSIRPAGRFEFPEIGAQRKVSTAEQINEFIQNVGASDATTIADGLGIDRSTVSRTLQSGPYTPSREGKRVVYSVSGQPEAQPEVEPDPQDALF